MEIRFDAAGVAFEGRQALQPLSVTLTERRIGVIVLYAFGITYLALVVGLGFEKAFMGSLAFIPGDALKAVLAALAGRAVMAGYPLLPQRA